MRLNRLRLWLGLERNILVMLTTVLLLGMGEELWTRFVPKYLELLGASVWVIALYGTLKDFLDAIYQYPGGWFADRLGRRAALSLFILVAILGYVIYLFSPSWEWILVGTLFVMAWGSLTSPAIFAIIGDNLPQHSRAIGFGVQSILKRVPIVIAPPLGGWLIDSFGFAAGIKRGLLLTIFLAFVAIIIVRSYYKERAPIAVDKTRFRAVWHIMDPRLKRLLVADCFARWAEGIPKVFIVIYVIDVLRFEAFKFGWLTSVEMVVAILLYIPFAKLSDKMNRKPFVLLTFAFFALFPLVLISATRFFWVALAFVIAGLRELGEPARKALIVDLAQVTARGRAVGMYYFIRGIAVFPASLIGGWLWTINHKFPFYSAFLVGVIGWVLYTVSDSRERPLLQMESTERS